MTGTIQLTRAQQRRMQKLTDSVDRVTQADRRFFERFPHRKHRVRVAAQCEIEQQEIIQGAALYWPDGCRVFCVVRNIASGVRLRLFTLGLEGADTDLDEDTARGIYEASAGSQTRTIEVQLRKAAEARA